jgi:tetratricopeptide (TPR) repeat protein
LSARNWVTKGPARNNGKLRKSGAYLEIGNAFNINGLEILDAAISLYKIAIELDPLYVDAWLSIGNVLMLLEDFVNANIYLEKAKKIDPTNPYVWYSKGLMFARRNSGSDVSNALSHFRKSVDLGLNDSIQLRVMYQYFSSYGDSKYANISLKRLNNLL